MTDHLPECPCPTNDDDPWYCCADCNPEQVPPSERGCICDRLRTCEQRVRQETFDADWSEMGQLAAVRLFRRQAFLAGLNAAREAVAALIPSDDYAYAEAFRDALAAIDALREEP